MIKARTQFALAVSLCVALSAAQAQTHPDLVLTKEGVDQIRKAKSMPPLFQAALDEATARIERSLIEGVVLPAPVDPGGGYSHERHKENYKIIHDAGILFQLTGDRRYFDHARDYLLGYAEIYDDLPLHPQRKEQAPGKLFWQSLNESVWLVYVIQGFDAIASGLDAPTRDRVERDLLRPAAAFLSSGTNEETFRKIHNHGTWAAAAVGMTGYSIGDAKLVEDAIMGLDGDGSSGFLAQLSQLFSPDGYYTEGPYYQRYALMPFVVFAEAIENNEPERKIFEYRDGIVLKAIDATVQQSYAEKFFPINDAIKEKGLKTQELVYAVAAAYARTGREDLLSIARLHGETILSGPGLKVARAVAAGEDKPFEYHSMLLSDGPDGDQGGLAILRMGDGPLAQTVVAKNTGQGMGHGHFDKLSLLFYDQGREVLTDYGAARFLNVPTKAGGRYLPENESWAKQTIAHNTPVIGEKTQFGGDWEWAQQFWPTPEYFARGDNFNIVSATLENAYPDTVIKRTVIQAKLSFAAEPIVIDLINVNTKKAETVDLPFYFDGQLVDFDGALNANVKRLSPLGLSDGYQHLWLEAQATPKTDIIRLSWLTEQRFYTLHSVAPAKTVAAFVRTGANDPAFNLKSQQGVILRAPKASSSRFASVIEPHGIYDPAAEFTAGSESQIASIANDRVGDYDLVTIEAVSGKIARIMLSYDKEKSKAHTLEAAGRELTWNGFISIAEE